MNMQTNVLVSKYAHAFVNTFESVMKDTDETHIRNAVRYLKAKREYPLLLFFLKDQEKNRQDQMMYLFLDHIKLPHFFGALCYLLLKNKHAHLFLDVLQSILSLWYQKNQALVITISASNNLTDQEITEIISFVERTRKKKVIDSEFILAPLLLAGIRIESSDGFVWEYSIQKQLCTLNALLHQEGIIHE